MPHAPYDTGLLEAARAGDKDALVSLLTLAQPDIRRYAAHSCYASEHIDDAVQESLWILYRRVGALKATASFTGWLFAIVRRECWRLSRALHGTRFDGNKPRKPDRSTHRSAVEIRIDIARAIQSLPEHYREVVLLRDLEEMTIEEIAHALSKTRESIKATLHRARIMLREYLSA